MPRLCPLCRVRSIIGHGLRVRLAHDDHHDRISVRRGRCRPCRKTFTFLPEWVIPCGHYTLRCREQACERIASGLGVEQAAPDCQDPTRSPDATTLRRWAARRLASVWCWLKSLPRQPFLAPPTILAWDLDALCRILPIEVRSP